jgi:hypothetical protein
VSTSVRLLTASDPAWDAALSRAGRHDFFHRSAYHRAAERRDGSTALLVAVEQDGIGIALPLLLRAIPGTRWRDATSAYGYPGPVSPPGQLPDEVRTSFQHTLTAVLEERAVVTAFSRLHPMLGHAPLVGLGSIRVEGQTVAIALTGRRPDGSPVDGTEGYSSGCRRTLRRLDRHGFIGMHDAELRYLSEFTEIYQETMHRSGATTEYWYDQRDFDELTRTMPQEVKLFVALREGDVVAASLVTIHEGFAQDYLGGTRPDALPYSPDRLVVHTERGWALQHGLDQLHLGGGRGARADSLFTYKCGFAPPRHTFRTWRWVLDRDAYDEMVPDGSHDPEADPFFPRYRDGR